MRLDDHHSVISQLDPNRTLFEQSIELPYHGEWEFPHNRIDFIKVIGTGAFGEVWIARAKGIGALKPTDKSLYASRRRSRLRYEKKIPKTFLDCLCPDETIDDEDYVAVKTLKRKYTFNSRYRNFINKLVTNH